MPLNVTVFVNNMVNQVRLSEPALLARYAYVYMEFDSCLPSIVQYTAVFRFLTRHLNSEYDTDTLCFTHFVLCTFSYDESTINMSQFHIG